MFHVACEVEAIRKLENCDIKTSIKNSGISLQVFSYNPRGKKDIDAVRIRIVSEDNPDEYLEMMVDPEDLHQAISHATANESWEKIRERRMGRRYGRYSRTEEDE